MIELRCDNCNKIFHRKGWALTKAIKRNQHSYFCSRECSRVNSGNKLVKYYSNNRKDNLSSYRWYIRVSSYRNKEMDLTPEYLKEIFENQEGKCVYTKVPLQLWNYKVKGGNNKLYTASLDRIDSSKPYVKGNVQFVSMAANLMKHTMTHEETIEFCKIIACNYQDKDIVQ